MCVLTASGQSGVTGPTATSFSTDGFAITVPAGENRAVLAVVVSSASPSAITLQTTQGAMTEALSQEVEITTGGMPALQQQTLELHYLALGTGGEVTVTATTPPAGGYVVQSFAGVDQTAPVGQTAGGAASASYLLDPGPGDLVLAAEADYLGNPNRTFPGPPLQGYGGPWTDGVAHDLDTALFAYESLGVPIHVAWDDDGFGTRGLMLGAVIQWAEPPPALFITEVMADPASPEPRWEWVEVFNNGPTPVDLFEFVVDNGDATAFTGPNILGGEVPPQGTAILYNADEVSGTEFEVTWGSGFTLIPVSPWPTLGNDGDSVALWRSNSDYAGDHQNQSNAITRAAFDGADPEGQSVYLPGIGLDSTDPANWTPSTDVGQVTPFGTVIASMSGVGNVGGELGSPGGPDLPETRILVTVEVAESIAEGDAGTTPLPFNVKLTGLPSGTVTVDAKTHDDTATTADNDYQAIDTTLSFDGSSRAFTENNSLTPLEGFSGDTYVAAGDVNRDGVADLVVGAGAGAEPSVVVIDGATGDSLLSFLAYAETFTGGVYVASGDINGDGFDDIITGPGAGGGPNVEVFSGTDGAELHSFDAFASTFLGGVRVATGDVNGDGLDDIVTGAGPGGGSAVKVFDGSTLVAIYDFFVDEIGAFSGGLFVACGDIDNDDNDDIITGLGDGALSQVQVFSGATLGSLADFFAFSPSFTGGVRVASGDFNGDGQDDIVTAAGSGGGPEVQIFSGAAPSTVLENFFSFDPSFMGGTHVGGIGHTLWLGSGSGSGTAARREPVECRTVNVDIQGDLNVEPNESFDFELSNIGGAGAVGVGFPDNGPDLRTPGFIQDDDAPAQPLDFGDLPNEAENGSAVSYATRNIDDGARHFVGPNLFIGDVIDGEADGNPSLLADGDDLDVVPDDEDGVTEIGPFAVGAVARFDVKVTNTTGGVALLYGFVDWNFDGDFEDLGESVTAAVPDGALGVVVPLDLPIPINANVSENVGARFRLSTSTELSANGLAPDGEVEDLILANKVTPPTELDFGDLPDVGPGTGAGSFKTATLPEYRTTLADNGPRHGIVPGLSFADDSGAIPPVNVDSEPDGQPSLAVDGDDNDGGNDEGGLQAALMEQEYSLVGGPDVVDFTFDILGSLSVENTTGVDATVQVWVDLDENGEFDPVSEKATIREAGGVLAGGVVPGDGSASAVTFEFSDIERILGRCQLQNEPFYFPVRARLSTDSTIGPVGPAPDGEVEDHLIMIEVSTANWCPAADEIDFGDLPDVGLGTAAGSFASGTPPDYRTTLADNGPRHVIVPGLSFADDSGTIPPANVDVELNGIPSLAADGDDNDGTNDEGGLQTALAGQSVALVGGGPDVDLTLDVAGLLAVENTTGMTAFVQVWVDLNEDGVFDPATEAATIPAQGGVAAGGIVPGDGTATSVRFDFTAVKRIVGRCSLDNEPFYFPVRARISTENTIGPFGPAPDGEVEDHLIVINVSSTNWCQTTLETDYGDLPDAGVGTSAGVFDGTGGLPDYRTTLADNGPRHVIDPDLAIGENSAAVVISDLDDEPNGQPTADATGDDVGGFNDENGLITALASMGIDVLENGPDVDLNLTLLGNFAVRNTTGSVARLQVWCDENLDGDFDDPGELATVVDPVVPATGDIPGDGSVDSMDFEITLTRRILGQCFLDGTFHFPIRARLSTDTTIGPFGPAPDGEVEDHLISVELRSDNWCSRTTDGNRLRVPGIVVPDLTLGLTLQDFIPQPFLQGSPQVTWEFNGTELVGTNPELSPSEVALLEGGALLFAVLDYGEGSTVRLKPEFAFLTDSDLIQLLNDSGLPDDQKLPHLDPDGDGESTLKELALGSGLNDGNSRVFTPSGKVEDSGSGDDHLVQSFLRRVGGSPSGDGWVADGIRYRCVGSASLGEWDPTLVEEVPNPPGLPTPPSGYEWVSFRFKEPTQSAGRGFLQIQIDLD
jgi:hypothetical protein